MPNILRTEILLHRQKAEMALSQAAQHMSLMVTTAEDTQKQLLVSGEDTDAELLELQVSNLQHLMTRIRLLEDTLAPFGGYLEAAKPRK